MARGPEGAESFLIKGARVIDPSQGIDAPLDILIEQGILRRMARGIKAPRAFFIDATDKVVFPGLVDMHVHLRDLGEAHKETVATGTRAAAKGGVTAVVNEPNTLPPLDSLEAVGRWEHLLRRDAVVRVWTKVCITRTRKGKALAPLEELSRHPLVVAATDDGNPVPSDDVMAEAAKLSARIGLLLTPHCEDGPGLPPRGPRAFWNEPYYVERELRLAERFGTRIHICHVSMADSIELIRRAKGRGVRVTCEATPHHLVLDQGMEAIGPDAKVNPPLRTRRDVEALQQALKEGVVDVIASDHAPHSPEEKARGWQEAPFGVIGLETSLGVIYTELVLKGVINLEEMVRLMSFTPARILGLPVGALKVGREADLVIFDPEALWKVDPATFASKGRNTPFKGWELKGRVLATFVRGKPVVLGGELLL